MLKIGDFSRLTQVSIRMLRYYDEIGLLKPVEIDLQTSYRFYSSEQIPRVNRIFVLKEMGFSLSEICGLMKEDIKPEQIAILLENRRRVIASTIEQEQDRLLRVEALLSLIKREGFMLKYEVALKSIPAYRVASLRKVIATYQEEGSLWEEMQQYAESTGIKGIEPFYAIYHDLGYKEQDVDVEVTMRIVGDAPETEHVCIRSLEAVPEMAIVIHQGPFEEMTAAYHALGNWMETTGYEMNGPTRAIYHKGPWCEQDPAQYLTEIQAPVTKHQSKS